MLFGLFSLKEGHSEGHYLVDPVNRLPCRTVLCFFPT